MSLPSSLRPKRKGLNEPLQQEEMQFSLDETPSQNNLPKSLKLKNPSTLRPKQDFEIPSEEDTQRDIERAQARTLTRMGESILGAPGDIASVLSGLFGKDQKILPTSSKIREATKNASQGYLEPKTEFEEKVDELASDVALMAFPGAGKYNLIRNIGIPVVGNLVKEGLKYGNASDKTSAYTKVGTMIALDLLSRRSGGVKKYAGSLFQKSEEAIPKGISIDASGLERSLENLQKNLTAGGSRPTTKKALEKLSEIRSEIKDGKIDAKRLAAYRPSINEAIDELGGFQLELPRKLKPQAIRNLNQVKNETIKTLEQYGEKFNPEYLKYSRDANEAWAAYSQSNRIAKFLRDKVSYTPKSKAVQALFSYAAPHAIIGVLAKVSPGAGVGAAAAMGAYQGVKILNRVYKSPVLRKYYQRVLKEAAAGNAPEAMKNLKALDHNLDDLQ